MQTLSAPDEVTPVLGLTRGQLLPVVESVAGEAVASFRVTVRHKIQGHYGYGGEKLIPTFSYRTQTGRVGQATVFVKCQEFESPVRRESRHYKALAEHGVPVPRLYAVLALTEEQDILFVECLEPIRGRDPFTDFFDDPESLLPFLRLAARLNATEPAREYAASLPRTDLASQVIKQIPTLEEIWSQAATGALGDAVKNLCVDMSFALLRLQRQMGALAEPLKEMELALCHNDFWPDSCAWRHEPRELLLVDLETVGFAPRFSDITGVIGPPDDVFHRCLSRDELAQHYADEYARHGGKPLPVKQLLDEVRTLWLSGELSFLWWMRNRAIDGLSDWTSDREEARLHFRRELLAKLEIVLKETE